jgi:hypothetical protein
MIVIIWRTNHLLPRDKKSRIGYILFIEMIFLIYSLIIVTIKDDKESPFVIIKVIIFVILHFIEKFREMSKTKIKFL